MEKVKMNYKKVSLELFFVLTFVFTIAILMNFIPLKSIFQIPIWVLCIILFYNILDRLKWHGYYIGKEGISLWFSGKMQTVKWNEVTVSKDFLGEKIVLARFRKNYYIHTVSNMSLFRLIKIYCPHDHELYKAIKEYTEKENIQF